MLIQKKPPETVRLTITNLMTGWSLDKLLPEPAAYKFISGLPDFCCEASRAGLICACWFEISVSDVDFERGEGNKQWLM